MLVFQNNNYVLFYHLLAVSMDVVSQSPQVQFLARACENVASDLWLGGGFSLVLRFPLPVTTG